MIRVPKAAGSSASLGASIALTILLLSPAALASGTMRSTGSERGQPGPSTPSDHPLAFEGSTVSPGGWWELPIAGSSPANRTDAQMAYDGRDGYVLLFGGCPGYTEFGECGPATLGDTWSFAGGIWKQVHPAASPPARSSGVMANDPGEGYVVLFGGNGVNGTLNDTWTFEGGTWIALSTPIHPPPLEWASMAYDASSSELVLEGGFSPGNYSASYGTWVFKAGLWTNETSTVHPPGWIAPLLAPWGNGGDLVLYGGLSALALPTYSEQTWLFSNGAWRNVTASTGTDLPGALAWVQGGYDPTLNETLLFGGGGGASIDENTWALSGPEGGGSWSELSNFAEPPGAFYQTQAAWDPQDGYFVGFCAESLSSYYGFPTIGVVHNTTWALVPPFTGRIHGTVPSPSAGQTVTLLANASGGLPPVSYAWAFGDGSRSYGSNVSHTYEQEGRYVLTLNATDEVGQLSSESWPVNVSYGSTTAGSGPGISGPSGIFVLAIVLGGLVGGVVGYFRRLRRRRPPAVPPLPGSGSPP